MFTTLNQIRSHSPFPDVWKKLLSHLGKTKADDAPLSIATVIDSNGFDDAIWCLRAVEGKDKEIRLYTIWCARQVQHLMTDKRSIDALDVAERFANGEATQEELTAASISAMNATDAAYDASSASDTADAAWYAASGAAWAAWTTADAAYDAADAAQNASDDASNASDAACNAAYYASNASDAASCNNSADVKNAQEARLREICQ